MEVILKNGTELILTHIMDDELDVTIANNEEVITTFSISDEDKKKINKGCKLNADMSITETQDYLDNMTVKVKADKKEAIQNVASISDQLNLIADVITTITSDKPNQDVIDNANAKFNDIKNILNK